MDTIREYWDKSAREHGEKASAVTGDVIAARLEVRAVLNRLSPADYVLDVGCGNGYKDIAYARKAAYVEGVDFSDPMIDVARGHAARLGVENLLFAQDDIRVMHINGEFDVVISNRCLINLPNRDDQAQAFFNLYRAVKPGGTLMLIECFEDGLKNLNAERVKFNLPPMEQRWHNLYLSDAQRYDIRRFVLSCNGYIVEDHFASTYYLISRTINAAMGGTYGSRINRLAAQLDPVGRYAPVYMVYIKKGDR